MSLSALVIGYGSIGKRHVEVLAETRGVSNISVLTSKENLPYETISSLDDIIKLNPDYIVVASPTNNHFLQLKFLEENFLEKKILVEKPLFDSKKNFEIKNNKVYVGYNLRFHPILDKLKSICESRVLWNINILCGSYLPDWRPNKDYRNVYSAKKELGGGVLLDLSHELDYISWLIGSLNIDYIVSEKVSNLEIESDDLLIFSGRTLDGAYVQINLNYFTRKPIRQIIIDGEGISIQGDLIKNQLSLILNGEISNYSWPNFQRNDTYRAQHEAVLQGNLNNLCTYQEGLTILRLIEKIRTFHS